MPTARNFLIRGMLAGFIAGLVAFGVGFVVGEPSIEAAIAVEQATGAPAEHDHGDSAATGEHSHGEEAGGHSHDEGGTGVSRDLQSTVGLLTATTVVGVVLGGFAGLLSALAMGRFGRASLQATTMGVAVAGFVSMYVVPFLVYPPNPPAVGSATTIGERTTAYFVMMGISILGAVAAVIAGRALHPRFGGWHASLIAIGGYVAAMAVAFVLMPGFNEVGDDFPAQVLYEFRVGSLLTQFALWIVIGAVLTELVCRLVKPPTEAQATPVATASA